MEPLIKLVAEKTGISHEQATSAVNTVLNFVKDKLPAGIGQQLDGFINDGDKTGSTGTGGGIDSLKDALGGMFGK